MKNPSNILILTPTAFPSVTGNAMTVERWRSSLSRKGIAVTVLATEHLRAGELLHRINEIKPDLIHAHHVLKAGALLLAQSPADRTVSIPLVLSPAGTDMNQVFSAPASRETVLKVCRAAQCIVTQSPWLFEGINRLLQDMGNRIVYIPKSFQWLGNDLFDPKKLFTWQRDDFIFFFPAGIRPVKNNLACLKMLRDIHRERPRIRVLFAGPPLDRAYAGLFAEELARCTDFARWVESIPPAAMQSAYGAAEVVLNASRSEGLSNTLLESIAAGRPLLASRVPGNEWPVTGNTGDDPCGCFFHCDDFDDFRHKALMLVDDMALRHRLASSCLRRAARLPNPDEEATQLCRVYRSVLK